MSKAKCLLKKKKIPGGVGSYMSKPEDAVLQNALVEFALVHF